MPYMASMARTTVYLDSGDYLRLKSLAEKQGRKTAELVREAVSEYARAHTVAKKPRSVGAGHSGRADVSERADQLLKGMGRSK
jgi:hypothetical protein